MAPPSRARRKPESQPVFDRVPPQNVEAERCVLGAMLLNPDVVSEAIEVLGNDPSETFYVEAHQHLYAAILALFRASQPIDSVTLMHQMGKGGTLEAAGGVSYIAGLTSAVPTSANVSYYAQIVTEAAISRRLISTCSRIAGEAYNASCDVKGLLGAAQDELLALSSDRATGFTEAFSDLDAALTRFLEPPDGLMTGFTGLDRVLGGLEQDAFVVVGARPSVGKTAFMLGIAMNAARAGKRVAIFALEMGKASLEDRMLYSEAQLVKARVRAGLYNRDELVRKLGHATSQTYFTRIHIDDTARVTSLDIAAKLKSLRAKHHLDLVILDYIQLVEPSNLKADRHVQVGQISRELKILTKAIGCPVMVLSQLSREAEKVDKPTCAHLRESGSLEQDANVIMLLSPWQGEDGVMRVDVAKNRNFETGEVGLVFDKSTQTFRDWCGSGIQKQAPAKRGFSAPVENDYNEDDSEPF